MIRESNEQSEPVVDDRLADMVAAIINHPEFIEETDEAAEGDEIYFQYRGHKMSIIRFVRPDTGRLDFTLYLYPRFQRSLSELVSRYDRGDTEGIKVVSFSAADVDHPELFRKLHDTVKRKHLKIDEIFEDIIRSGVAKK